MVYISKVLVLLFCNLPGYACPARGSPSIRQSFGNILAFEMIIIIAGAMYIWLALVGGPFSETG